MLKKSQDHLAVMHETYWEHMAFALEMAWIMLSGGMLIIFHALIPAIFERSGSKRIALLGEKMRERQARCQK
jgi:hypothetical protein